MLVLIFLGFSALFSLAVNAKEQALLSASYQLVEVSKNNQASFTWRQKAPDPIAIGSKAPDFTQAGLDGKLVKLSDFQGKWVLVQFWFSSCPYCIAENKHLVAYYEDQAQPLAGLDILFVSFDGGGSTETDKQQRKAKWLTAIKDQKLEQKGWTHVSDLKGWGKNTAGNMYGIQSTPSNILVDPDGFIKAKNVMGEALLKAYKQAK